MPLFRHRLFAVVIPIVIAGVFASPLAHAQLQNILDGQPLNPGG